MLYVDIPTPHEISNLNLVRSDACVSIYLSTTPRTQEIGKSRTMLAQFVKEAVEQLEAAGVEKRRIWPLEEHFETVSADDEFWEHQAHSLAILATPTQLRTYRLASDLTDMVAVSDRFHLKPLLRAVTFPNAAHILAVSENAVRLIEVSSNLPAVEVKAPNMPRDAATAVGKATINDRSPGGRLQGMEGQKVRLGQYIRKIDAAVRPVLSHSSVPVILAATQPLEALFRSLSGVAVLDEAIESAPDHMTDAELAEAVRPILDAHYAQQIAGFHTLFETRRGQGRATTDISDAAKAATFGGIETLLVDIDTIVAGTVDETTGAVAFMSDGEAGGYGVVDEIAGRALRTGARVLAVRQQDIPDEKPLAAMLRYPV